MSSIKHSHSETNGRSNNEDSNRGKVMLLLNCETMTFNNLLSHRHPPEGSLLDIIIKPKAPIAFNLMKKLKINVKAGVFTWATQQKEFPSLLFSTLLFS